MTDSDARRIAFKRKQLSQVESQGSSTRATEQVLELKTELRHLESLYRAGLRVELEPPIAFVSYRRGKHDTLVETLAYSEANWAVIPIEIGQ